MDIIPDFDSARGIVLSAEESKNNRLKAGLCPTCTKKLFDIKRSKFNPLKVTKVPLTDENAIKGRCRVCDPPEGEVADSLRSRAKGRVRATVSNIKERVNINELDQAPKQKNRHQSSPTINFTSKGAKNSDESSLKTSTTKKFRRPPPKSNYRRSSTSDEVPEKRIVDGNRRASYDDGNTSGSVNGDDEYIPRHKSHDGRRISRHSNGEFDNHSADGQGPYLNRPKSYDNSRNIHSHSSSYSSNARKKSPHMASMNEYERYDPACYGGHNHFNDHQSETSSVFSDRNDPTEAENEVQDVITALFGEQRPHYQRMLCNQLLSFARNAKLVVEIVMSGGLMAVHSLMTGENSMDTPLQEVTCRLMKVLCPTADDSMLQQIPLVETITCLMMVHTSLNLQESCITILRELSDRNDTFKGLIDDSGGIDIVLSALRQYESPVLRKDGQILVTNLSRYIDGTS